LNTYQWQKTSVAALFVDAIGAFYSVVREVVLNLPRTDHAVARICAQLQLPPEAAARVMQRLSEAPTESRLDRSDHAKALMREAHRATWFRFRSTGRTVAVTRRGPRPGDPWGDYLFNLLMVEILEEIADECTNAGLVTLYRGEQLQSWMEAPLAALVDVTFMDDVVVIVDAPTARDLPRRSAQAAAIVFDAFATRGIRVNLQQHKTARMVATRGDGAQTALAELAQGDFPSIQVRSEVLGDMQVHVIRAYTHLGTVAEAQHRLKPELQHRNQSAKGALYPLRQKFYANPRIPMTPRGGILEADVLSRQLFNTAVWGPVAPGEDKKLRGEYAALLRPLPPGDLRSREAGVTHRALAAWTNRLPLPLVLAFAHLAHLCRICRDTDAQLTTVLQWETSVAPAGKSWLEHSLPCVQTVRCHLSPEHRQS